MTEAYQSNIISIMTDPFTYNAVSRIDLLDPKYKLLHKLNAFALIAVLAGCAVGVILNYFLRIPKAPGGIYIVYILVGVVACVIYPYIHEFTHAFAILLIKRKMPKIKFGKLAATCGSPDIMFSKLQYFIVVSFPCLFFCAVLIPLTILLPGMFFPLPYMPLCYNVFGSVADWIMIFAVKNTPKKSIIVDCGTEAVIYAPAAQA